MTNDPNDQIIPEAYVGREQALIKHILLRGYLERLLYIVGYNAHALGLREVTYVDCFAGPWQDESEDLSATSIGISLHIIEKVIQGLAKVGKTITFRAIYVEKDREAFARLQRFLNCGCPPGVQATCIQGDFVERIPDIQAAIPLDSFAFFFIDPKGWSVVKPGVLRPLLSRLKSEFLINFMYDFANRAVSMEKLHSEMAQLFGQSIDMQELPHEPVARERYLLNLYRKAITNEANGAQRSSMTCYVPVFSPLADRTKYHLVYLTRHPKGVVEFMEQAEKVAKAQNKVRTVARYRKQIEASRSLDLFGLDTDVQLASATDAKKMAALEQLWLSKFRGGELKTSVRLFAELLSESDCFPSEIQEAMRSLIAKGLVTNTSAGDIRRRIRNVVRFEDNEKLLRNLDS